MQGSFFDIVFIEDLQRYHKIYEQAIAGAIDNAKVHFATTGKAGLDQLAALADCDLVVLDLGLPDMPGTEVLAKIRSDQRYERTPVLVLTAQGGVELQLQLLDQGADDFVEKSSDPEVFMARIKAQMRHRLALERLTQVAVERDIFAAGVLHEIMRLQKDILSSCQTAKQWLSQDAAGHRNELQDLFRGLRQRSTELGVFAADVIKSTQENREQPSPQTIDLSHWLPEQNPDAFVVPDSVTLPKIKVAPSYLKMSVSACRRILMAVGDSEAPITVATEPSNRSRYTAISFSVRVTAAEARNTFERLGKSLEQGEGREADDSGAVSATKLQWALLESATGKLHGTVTTSFEDESGRIGLELPEAET